VVLAALGMAAAATRLLPRAVAVLDFRFYVLSVLMALYFVSMLALRARDRGAPAGKRGRRGSARGSD